MWTWDDRLLWCPGCAAGLRARRSTGVHLSIVPELRDDVLARRFHRVVCHGCAAPIEAQRPLLHIDFERDHWVLVANTGELGLWPAYEARLRDNVARVLGRGSPLMQELAGRLRVRLVFGHEELREKLLIWSAGLDDAVVECLKLRVYAADPALAAPGSRLLVDSYHDHALDLLWFARAADARPARVLITPSAWLRDTDRDRAALAARFPELFGGGFVSAARLVAARSPADDRLDLALRCTEQIAQAGQPAQRNVFAPRPRGRRQTILRGSGPVR